LRTAKKRKKSTENVGALEYALPFKKFYQRNDENRISGESRCFDNFSNSLGGSSNVILNKSPIYIIPAIFFLLYHLENDKDDISSKNRHLKS
jgi:hypothetical protein